MSSVVTHVRTIPVCEQASVGIVTGTRRTTAGGWGMISLRNPSFQRVIPSTQMISDHTSDNCAAPISG
eukprot:m.62400 g.62400  ORF g.62400 m.62400 type:complete len:68 (-) comp17675_c0_seq7:967-1170(-)